MDQPRTRLLRQLPAVDEILRHPRLAPLVARLSRPFATEVIRHFLKAKREQLLHAPPAELPGELKIEELLAELGQALTAAGEPSLSRVINATGVVIHTNLGRSPLAPGALSHLVEISRGYSNLEYDLKEGRRGSRQDHLEALLTELTRAEAALVVNNNAAAVLLALNTLAKDKEVVISRGQLVEIGGSFRMPEIMAASGAILKEVGTTNKTYLKDYERAVTSETALILKVHPSNYRITGFTHEVALPELVELGRRFGLPVMEDLGSGCFLDLGRYGLEREPTVQDTVAAGAALVTVSGDKLLGGPQAGIILGRRETVARLRQNPLTRALRPDKLTLAGLEATLQLYLDEPRAVAALPTLRMITRPLIEVERQARRLARTLRRKWGDRLQVEIRETIGRVGGGALPQAPLPSRALVLTLPPLAAHQLEANLRCTRPPVIARVERDALLLDLRTVLPEDEPDLLSALQHLLSA